MQTLPYHFAELLFRIEPKDDRLELAQGLPAFLRDYLQTTALIVTRDPHTRLAGSYARHTAVKRIKDVDIILRVDDFYRDVPLVVLNDLVKALKALPNYAGDRPLVDDSGDVALRRQRRSVQVHFNALEFDVDVVPALAPDGMDGQLFVPDREWKEWIATDALRYGDYLSKLNAQNCRKVVPLIKMLKHWRDMHMVNLRPKSFWLECLVVQSVAEGWLVVDGKSYAEIFRDLLDAVYEKHSPFLDVNESEWSKRRPHIPDPMIPKSNVAFNWEKSAFTAFMSRVDESLGWATRALDKPEDKIEEAIALWCKVFNCEYEEYFPTWVVSPALEAARLAGNGQLRVSQSGQILIAASNASGIAVPKHRFYGKEDA